MQHRQAALSIGMQEPKCNNDNDKAQDLLDNYFSIRDDAKGVHIRSIDVNTDVYGTLQVT